MFYQVNNLVSHWSWRIVRLRQKIWKLMLGYNPIQQRCSVSMKGQHVLFLRKKQVLSGHIIRHPRKSETLYRPLDVHGLEKRHVQCSQAITRLSLICSVKYLNLSFYGHGIWSPYTRQVLQLSSPKATCVICYCVCVCMCVLGVMRAGRVLGECSGPWNTVIYWTPEKCVALDSLKHLSYAGKAS